MNWCIRVISVKHTYRYAPWYAHDTVKFISDKHLIYLICTYLYRPVSACICMYHKIIGAVSCAYMHVCWIHSAHIHADTYGYELLRGVHICMYLAVFLSWIHANMHSCIQCISVCIRLYFDPEYMRIWISDSDYIHLCTLHSVQICIYLSVFLSWIHAHMPVLSWIKSVFFIAPDRPPTGTGKWVGGYTRRRQLTGGQARGASGQLRWTGLIPPSWGRARGASSKTAQGEAMEVAARPIAWALAPTSSLSTRNKCFKRTTWSTIREEVRSSKTDPR